jgi:hypothetical protein
VDGGALKSVEKLGLIRMDGSTASPEVWPDGFTSSARFQTVEGEVKQMISFREYANAYYPFIQGRRFIYKQNQLQR